MNPALRLPRALACALLVALFLRPAALPAAAEEPKPAAAPAAEKSAVIENSVVKIFSTARYPDLYKPWGKQAPRESTGSGVIIEGRRILTNAHVVLYASQVQVQANQSGDKISATVVAISPGIDLAVLKLDDESFFDTRPPMPRATALPAVKDSVLVQGFPTGGTSLSITKGIVSRIEFTAYNFPTSGLRIQIDAAINPGNSGGPAIAGDKMIGLAFSRLGGGDNIGYIIPNEEIELFLADAADGHLESKPAMFDALQTFHNPALRPFLHAEKTTAGIIVNHADDPDPVYPLKPWDIITRIGDTPVDEEGMIKLDGNLRVNFRYLIQKIARDGHVPLTVVRAGRETKLSLPVAAARPMLLRGLAGEYPPYFVCGPMVFSVATQDFLGGFNNLNLVTMLSAVGSPLSMRRGDRPAFAGEQLVVVSSPFFPHKLSKGYSNPIGRVVTAVNGVVIKHLAHLVETLRDATGEFLVFEFGGREQERLVFPRKDMIAATEEILNDNGVRAQGSPELMKVWAAKP